MSVVSNLGQLSASTTPFTQEVKRDDAASSADAAEQKLSDEFDEFMLLLTTQLQNQDPTEPMDTNQFTAQLVQFTGVEQAVDTNKNLEKLVALSESQQLNATVSYVGKQVEADGNALFLNDGEATMNFEIPAGAKTVTLAVIDEAGNAVYTEQLDPDVGRQSFTWNGENSFDKSQMPDGLYNYGLAITNYDGKAIEGTTYVTGKVTSARFDGDESILLLDGALEVPQSRVLSVSEITPTVETGTDLEEEITS